MSNVRNTWSQNSSALPDGKNILYMSTNFAGVRRPFGQSCCNWTREHMTSINGNARTETSNVVQSNTLPHQNPQKHEHRISTVCVYSMSLQTKHTQKSHGFVGTCAQVAWHLHLMEQYVVAHNMISSLDPHFTHVRSTRRKLRAVFAVQKSGAHHFTCDCGQCDMDSTFMYGLL